MIKRLNFGCGNDYREGWINLDVAEEEKWQTGRRPDILIHASDTVLPLETDAVDYVLADNVLEHVERERVHGLLLEFHRILRPGGILDIWVPHFTGIGVKYLEHVRGYGVNSFWYYENYFAFRQQLLLFSRSPCAVIRWPGKLNALNPLFNLSTGWQQICEKYWPGGFEEIHYVMTKKG